MAIHTSFIAGVLQDSPEGLRQLGHAFMTDCYEVCPAAISQKHCQQIGYIVTQVLLNRGFPFIDLADSDPLDRADQTYKIIRITSGWVHAIFLQTDIVIPLSDEGKERTVIEVDLNVAIRIQMEGFFDNLRHIHPERFKDNPCGWVVKQLGLFSLMPHLKSYQETVNKVRTQLAQIARGEGKSDLELGLKDLRQVEVNITHDIQRALGTS